MPADEKQPTQSSPQKQTETRQKRAKIVSACSECRRKKTRCNGEQPCRNCQKSSSPCVYPVSHSDDKRNGPSRAALEAIEERLQTIEDMLKTIVQSQVYRADLDPVAVSRFLNKDSSSSATTVTTATTASSPPPPPPPSTSSGPPSYNRQHLYISPSPQPSPPSATSLTNTATPPTSGSSSTGPNLTSTTTPSSPPPSSGREVRLPSIHSLSAPPTTTEHRDLPPLNSLQDYCYPQQPSFSSSKSNSELVDNQQEPIDRKRKR
ncbi:hypothetical protein BC941DRAFT_437025 [Chlamydoabsidia padenii]|nr:hypothetical protein BC941DRAFT_437025 [Chlamydoabsidia padenii]